MHFLGLDLTHVLQTYGYWAVLGLVLLETAGVPAPGETMLIAAAAYAGATHHMSVLLVIACAAGAAILGDNAGFWVGREGGWRLLCRYGSFLHVEPYMLKVGVYVFRRHGAKIVFFGRFIPILRTWGALLTGVNRYPWRKFLVWNALGGIAWATGWGMLAYAFGKVLENMEIWASVTAVCIAVAISVISAILIKRHAKELRECAEREFPGDLRDIDRKAA